MDQKGNLGDTNLCTNPGKSVIFTELVIYIICSISKHFTLVWTMFIEIQEKFMCNTSDSDKLHGQGHNGIKQHFQHVSTGRTS